MSPHLSRVSILSGQQAHKMTTPSPAPAKIARLWDELPKDELQKAEAHSTLVAALLESLMGNLECHLDDVTNKMPSTGTMDVAEVRSKITMEASRLVAKTAHAYAYHNALSKKESDVQDGSFQEEDKPAMESVDGRYISSGGEEEEVEGSKLQKKYASLQKKYNRLLECYRGCLEGISELATTKLGKAKQDVLERLEAYVDLEEEFSNE